MIVTYAVSLRGGNGESTITIPYIEKVIDLFFID